jgi:DNA invertase Pin-like site-specific DNA recombinase
MAFCALETEPGPRHRPARVGRRRSRPCHRGHGLRAGLRVTLLERYGFCGGAAVAGLSGTVCGLYAASENERRPPEQLVFGFAEEFVALLRSRGGITDPIRYGKTFTLVHDPLMWREAADHLLMQAGVNVVYHALVTATLCNGDKVEGVEVWTKQGRARVTAKLTIDASGDADVAASGLGLEAQRKAVTDYLNGGAWELVGEFVEVESGKKSDRPELARAIEACRKYRARLVIAKLDRLSRNLAFVATLMDSGVEFVAVDNPHANKLTIHILAAVAEHEREAISERTKAALAAAKARGKRLGTPDPQGAVKRMHAALKANTVRFAANVMPIIREIQASGHASQNAIAGQLNARKVATARGGKWTHVQVRQILDRMPERDTER